MTIKKSDAASADGEPTILSQDVPIPEGESAAHLFGEMRHHPEQIRALFREGKYPYRTRIRRAAQPRGKMSSCSLPAPRFGSRFVTRGPPCSD